MKDRMLSSFRKLQTNVAVDFLQDRNGAYSPQHFCVGYGNIAALGLDVVFLHEGSKVAVGLL